MYSHKQLSNIYDKQIRKHCDKYKIIIDDCMRDHFQDEFTCKIFKDEFLNCTNKFDYEFSIKHNLKQKKLNIHGD